MAEACCGSFTLIVYRKRGVADGENYAEARKKRK